MESGKQSFEIEGRIRAANYLIEIFIMTDERWPKICLREEIRGLKNRNPSPWGAELQKALKLVGVGETINLIWEGFKTGNFSEKIRENLLTGVEIRTEQLIQQDWNKIDRSKYCGNYKNWKCFVGKEEYWGDKNFKATEKEQWARLRCGNVGIAGNKGYKITICRTCKKFEENIFHIWTCEEALRKVDQGLVKKINQWRGNLIGNSFEKLVIKTLKSRPNPDLCRYARSFERIARDARLQEV